nr:aminotransferase class V-fold PLP-dependent enzyme [Kibdelosporangium sp. MJ126-NF4]CEL20004.1 Siderophore biosynthesis L-2,4-diaminobutyrate decarboxylase [Kibdelosporangium sp. MJ126-NF4]CTQ97228.1 Siderophore biosynthesis L-2,4-diaminobutyrate decarboxylase [Kibdelosporangium sp. MJ126-NF4]
MPEPGPLNVERERAMALLTTASAAVVQHHEDVAEGPVAPPVDTAAVRERLAAYDFAAPRPGDDVLADVLGLLREGMVHTSHPRYFGLFNPAPDWRGVAGELVAAAANPQLAAYSHAHAPVEIERHVLRFLAGRLGMPPWTTGSFTVGGAEANLTAVIVALTKRWPEYADNGLGSLPGRPLIYASVESHLAWLKIAHMTGLGRQAVRLVPVDATHRMDTDWLRVLLDADEATGHKPFLVVATAGTTGGGALDPVPSLAELAHERGLYLHVDAAWAGSVALSDRLRPLLSGVEHADSVTVDAHKWMSAPMGAGMFLTPHGDALRASFDVRTSYMPDAVDGTSDPYTSSVQWSRRFIGLKVFLALAGAGREAFAQQVERDVELGTLLAERLAARGWRRINDTPLPVVCVADPEVDDGDPDLSHAWHAALADEVVRRGLAWVSSVRLDGRSAVRLCVTSYRTTSDDIDLVADELDACRDAFNQERAARRG